jgi:hypothetical protein
MYANRLLIGWTRRAPAPPTLDPFSGTRVLLDATTTLYASTNADAAPEFQVKLSGLVNLTAGNFLHSRARGSILRRGR